MKKSNITFLLCHKIRKSTGALMEVQKRLAAKSAVLCYTEGRSGGKSYADD